MGWTLRKLIAGKTTVAAYCQNPRCHHTEKLNLEAIRDRLGPDAPAMSGDLLPSCAAPSVNRRRAG